MSAQDELPPGHEARTDPGGGGGWYVYGPTGYNYGWSETRGKAIEHAWRGIGITREELATMRAAQEFTRVVCELLGDEGSGMDVSTDVLQDMLTAAGVTP